MATQKYTKLSGVEAKGGREDERWNSSPLKGCGTGLGFAGRRKKKTQRRGAAQSFTEKKWEFAIDSANGISIVGFGVGAAN
jgi:hypothetical protein